MGLYALGESYGLETWYDYNGAYDLWTGTDLLLDQTRHLLASDAYIFQGVAWPKGTDVEVDFMGTFSGSLNLIPYSYIFGLTGYSQNNNKYTLRIYDKGAQTDLYYGQFAWFPTVLGTMGRGFYASGQFINAQILNVPYGPYFFRDPLIVLPPGNMQIQITNASEVFDPQVPMQRIQMLFLIAVPKQTAALNQRKVMTANDPSGIQSIGALASFLPG